MYNQEAYFKVAKGYATYHQQPAEQPPMEECVDMVAQKHTCGFVFYNKLNYHQLRYEKKLIGVLRFLF